MNLKTTHYAMVTDMQAKTIIFIGMPAYYSACSQVRMARKTGVKADVIKKSLYSKFSKAARKFGFTEK